MASKPVQRVGESDDAYIARLSVWRDNARASDRERYKRRGEKRRKYENDRYANDPEHRERKRQQSRDQYNRPPDGQVCEVCGASPGLDTRGRRMLHEDHRHDNNVIRGWLCVKCNMAVGVLDLRFTDPDRFAALAAWSLRGASAQPARSAEPKRRKRAVADPELFEVPRE